MTNDIRSNSHRAPTFEFPDVSGRRHRSAGLWRLGAGIVALTLAAAAQSDDWVGDDCKAWRGESQPNDTLTWTGPCLNELQSGYGTLDIRIGGWRLVGIGHMREGEFTGTATVTYPNGDLYKGNYRNDAPNGKGAYTTANGNRYEGDFRDGYPHGKGIAIWAKGDRYEGDFRDGKRNGRGIFSSRDGRNRYVGDYRDDQRNGRGVHTMPNGDRYEGDYRDGKRSGRGVFTSTSGERYEGDFRNDVYDGKGVLTTGNGGRFEGDFRNGYPHGKGVATRANGDTYVGDYRDGQPNGRGILTSRNGRRYEGEFVDGKHVSEATGVPATLIGAFSSAQPGRSTQATNSTETEPSSSVSHAQHQVIDLSDANHCISIERPGSGERFWSIRNTCNRTINVRFCHYYPNAIDGNKGDCAGTLWESTGEIESRKGIRFEWLKESMDHGAIFHSWSCFAPAFADPNNTRFDPSGRGVVYSRCKRL